MMVIVVVGRKNHKKLRLLFELLDKKTVKDVKAHVNSSKYSKAIANIFAEGQFIKELNDKEITHSSSSLIISDQNAYWNLM